MRKQDLFKKKYVLKPEKNYFYSFLEKPRVKVVVTIIKLFIK